LGPREDRQPALGANKARKSTEKSITTQVATVGGPEEFEESNLKREKILWRVGAWETPYHVDPRLQGLAAPASR
jgi:hypothetical protein